MARGLVTRDVQFEEIDQHHTTFKNDGTLDTDQLGMAVCMTGNKTVGLGWDGARVKGILKKVEDDDIVVIQDEGYVEELGYSAAPTVGDRIVSNGAGAVKAAGSAAGVGDHEVVAVDTDNEEVILKLKG